MLFLLDRFCNPLPFISLKDAYKTPDLKYCFLIKRTGCKNAARSYDQNELYAYCLITFVFNTSPLEVYTFSI